MLWKTKKSRSQAPSNDMASPPEVSSSPAVGRVSQFEVTPQNLDGSAKRQSGAFVVAKGYRVAASVITARPVVVLGELIGESLTSPSVSVGPNGRLNIPVETNTLTVEGAVERRVRVRDAVEVRSGGTILADVEAATISIAPGGFVSGAHLAIGPLRAV